MSEALSPAVVRHDVAIAMAKTVITKTGMPQSKYSEKLVPSKNAPKGFGAKLPYWAYILGIVEARLEQKNPAYFAFDVTEDFAKKTRSIPISKTNEAITAMIIKGFNEIAGGAP